MNWTISQKGLSALEGREALRLKAYKDSVGIPTIGWGHTGRMSPPQVKMGQVITRVLAEAYLWGDLKPVEKQVNESIKGAKAAVNQQMFDAMVSFCFNIGEAGFAHSTVVHMLQQGDKQGAAKAFLMWRKPKELLKRRQGEVKQFLS